MARRFLSGVVAMAGSFSGCTTTSPAREPAASTPAAAHASAPPPAAPLAASPAAKPDGAKVPAAAREAAADWQQTLVGHALEIELRRNLFLDASFDLYDELLEEKAVTAERGTKVSAAVKLSAERFDDLTKAVDRLRADLDRGDVQEALPLAGDEAQRDLEQVAELVQSYRPMPARPLAYDLTIGPSVASVLFQGRGFHQEEGLAELPKPQRDALLLLDCLRNVSSDTAFMVRSVTDWADVSQRLVAH